MLDQRAVVVFQLLPRFPHRGDRELRALLQALVHAGLFAACQPKV
jgi:hypothetical protein